MAETAKAGAAKAGATKAGAALADVQRDVVEEFSFFDDWADKYQYVIDLGKRLPPLSEEERVEANLLYGCVSQVWLVSEVVEADGARCVRFRADSDSVLVRGLIALVFRVYNDRPPEAIVRSKPEFLKSIGLNEYLSPSRSNGLAALTAHIFKVAQAAL